MLPFTKNNELRIVLGVALLFFSYAILHIGYGLPLHLIGDEESLLFGALKMLQLRTLPVFAGGEFSSLYYPIGLPVLYAFGAALYAVTAFIIARGVDTFAQLSDYILVHLEYPWLIARSLSAFAGAALVVVTYRLGKAIFPRERSAGLYAALFLATSFFTFQTSVVARHWVFSALLFALAFYFVVRHERTDGLSLHLAGLVAGLSVAVAQIGLVTIVLVACAYLMWNRINPRSLLNDREFRRYIAISGVLAVFFVLLHPGAFTFLAAGQATPVASEKGFMYVINELTYTISYLLQHEFVLTLFAALGLVILFVRKDVLNAALIAVPVVLYNIFLIVILHNAPRYHMYVIPLLSVAAGYAISRIVHSAALDRRRVRCALSVVIFIIPLASILRYGYLLRTPSTEMLAAEWVRAHAARGEAFVVNAPMLSFIHDDAFAQFQTGVGRVPLVSRSLSGSDIAPYGGQKIRYVNVHFWDAESTRAPLREFIALYRPEYAVISYDNQDAIGSDTNRFLRSLGVLNAAFDSGAAAAESISDPVQPFDEYGFLNARLFGIKRFGSHVDIYRFN